MGLARCSPIGNCISLTRTWLQTLGEQSLLSFDFFTDYYWVWAGRCESGSEHTMHARQYACVAASFYCFHGRFADRFADGA
jgi:hypothetical protein